MPKIDRTTVAMVVLVPLASFPSTHRSRSPCVGAGEREDAHSRKVGPGDRPSGIGEIVSLDRCLRLFRRLYSRLAAFLSAPPGPEQDCQNDRPNDAPADPRDVWVSCLPFEDFLMDGH